jgi:hypothetical protein
MVLRVLGASGSPIVLLITDRGAWALVAADAARHLGALGG